MTDSLPFHILQLVNSYPLIFLKPEKEKGTPFIRGLLAEEGFRMKKEVQLQPSCIFSLLTKFRSLKVEREV